MAQPDHVFIIGAMKAGTTTLFRQLAGHPDINPCTLKEPNFFASDANWAKGWTWYQGLWGPASGSKLEASGAYSRMPRDPGVPDRIRTMQEEHGFTAKFLYTIRDPLERIRSHLSHAVAAGSGYDPHALSHGGLDGYLLTLSSYARQLDEYRDRFGRDNLHVVVLEDLRDDAVATLGRTCRFLDLPTGWKVPEPAARHNPTLGLWRRGPLWRALSWTRAERAAMRLPEPMRRVLRPMVGRRLKQRMTLTPDQSSFYAYYLANDVARLEKEYGVDTSKWTHFHAARDASGAGIGSGTT